MREDQCDAKRLHEGMFVDGSHPQNQGQAARNSRVAIVSYIPILANLQLKQAVKLHDPSVNMQIMQFITRHDGLHSQL